jgi:hypothetical protein
MTDQCGEAYAVPYENPCSRVKRTSWSAQAVPNNPILAPASYGYTWCNKLPGGNLVLSPDHRTEGDIREEWAVGMMGIRHALFR